MFAQNQEVISGGGSYAESSEGSIAGTIGEAVIITEEGTNNHVTQGFHQPDIYVLHVEGREDIVINVFPNPTQDYLNIVSPVPLNMAVYDASGNLVDTVFINDASSPYDVSHLSRGVYMLVFTEGEQTSKTVQIIVQ